MPESCSKRAILSLYFFALPTRTPLLFAGHAVVVAIHLGVWARIEPPEEAWAGPRISVHFAALFGVTENPSVDA